MHKYLKIIGQISVINGRYSLSENQVVVLNIFAKRYLANELTTVGDLIIHKEIASQATLHKALKSLVRKRFLVLKSATEDKRVKHIFPTKLALTHYKNLEDIFS